jgi:hypothetical protein
VWGGLTAASKKAGFAPFVEIEAMAEEAMSQRVIEDLPRDFIRVMMSAMSEATLESMRQQPKQAAVYRRTGFEMLWKGLKRGG